MKYLIIVMLALTGCGRLTGEDAPKEEELSEEHYAKLSTCNKALQRLARSCSKALPVDVTRPKAATDYLGTCLYSMGKTYGDRFPITKGAIDRPDFFFKCLEELPRSSEKYCHYELDETRASLESVQDNLDDIRDRCKKWCERLQKLRKLEEWEDCACF